eukprot:scaffold602657_cov59-Attheya_sp.AAC.2
MGEPSAGSCGALYFCNVLLFGQTIASPYVGVYDAHSTRHLLESALGLRTSENDATELHFQRVLSQQCNNDGTDGGSSQGCWMGKQGASAGLLQNYESIPKLWGQHQKLRISIGYGRLYQMRDIVLMSANKQIILGALNHTRMDGTTTIKNGDDQVVLVMGHGASIKCDKSKAGTG